MPGVSIRQAPEGIGISARWVVVWRQRASLSRTSPVFIRSLPSRVLVSVDLPAPDEPTRTMMRRGCSQGERARSEEHTAEIQSLMRNSYAVVSLKKRNKQETR